MALTKRIKPIRGSPLKKYDHTELTVYDLELSCAHFLLRKAAHPTRHLFTEDYPGQPYFVLDGGSVVGHARTIAEGKTIVREQALTEIKRNIAAANASLINLERDNLTVEQELPEQPEENTANPSLPPYPGRPFFYAKWRGRWHKAIWHHVPQAMRIRGKVLDWPVRQCDGFDGVPDNLYTKDSKYGRTTRQTPPPAGEPRCQKCFGRRG